MTFNQLYLLHHYLHYFPPLCSLQHSHILINLIYIYNLYMKQFLPLIISIFISFLSYFHQKQSFSSQILTQLNDIQFDQSPSPDIQSEFYNTNHLYSWKSNSSLFKYFSHTQGNIYSHFTHEQNIQKNSTSTYQANIIYCFFLDPYYIDQKNILLILPLQTFYNKTGQFWTGITEANYTFGIGQQLHEFKIINTTFFINATFGNITIENTYIEFLKIQKQKKHYLIWLMAIPAVLIIIGSIIIQKNPVVPERISVTTLSLLINYLLVISMIQCSYGVKSINNQYRYWIVTGMITFLACFKFTQVFQNTLRKIHGITGYIKFYIFSAIYMILLLSYPFQDWFILLNSFWLLPQIIHNINNKLKQKVNIVYIILMIIPQFYSIYLKGVPQNYFLIAPNYYLCTFLIVIVAAQIIIIFGQTKYGNKFFIPKRFLPDYYNYNFQLIVKDRNLVIPECAICLISLEFQDPDKFIAQKLTQLTQQKFQQQKKINVMKTPCGHMFHIKCLSDWIMVKLQCPVDRSQLPGFQ